jgi:hypothetical protein
MMLSIQSSDANYFAHEGTVNQEVKAKNKNMSGAGFCVIQSSFS